LASWLEHRVGKSLTKRSIRIRIKEEQKGDGSFFITINNKNNHVSAWLSIGLSAREKLLLDKIQNFF